MTSAFRPFAFGVKFQRVIFRVFARLRFLQRLGLAAEVRHQQGVFVVEAVEVLEHGRAVECETVVAQPLQVADLHGHLRQLESVGVDFDGAELLHAHFRLECEAELLGEGDDFLFQAQQQLQRDVKEVAAAAGGVEDDDGASFLRKAAMRARSCGRAFAALEAPASRLGLERGPFAPERGHEDRLDEGDDVFAAGVLRAKGGALAGVQAAREERAHDAGLDELPVRLGGLGEQAAFRRRCRSKTVESSNRWPLK